MKVNIPYIYRRDFIFDKFNLNLPVQIRKKIEIQTNLEYKFFLSVNLHGVP